MSNIVEKKTRNESMDFAKLISAAFVLFIHAPFPGDFGELIRCIARIAVPLFMIITGYFSYGTGAYRLKRRLVDTIKLYISSTMLYVVYYIITTCISENYGILETVFFLIPDAESILRWLIYHENLYVFAYHLWYLAAIIATYGVLWIYACYFEGGRINYCPLYFVGMCLFAIFCVVAMILPASGIILPAQIYRNGWLWGIPMVTFGIFLGENHQKIWEKLKLSNRKLFFVFCIGLFLSILQWKAEAETELPFGAVIQIPAIMMYLIQNPEIPFLPGLKRIAHRYRDVSTIIYIVHIIVIDLYEQHIKIYITAILNGTEPWIGPVVILALSVIFSIIWIELKRKVKNKRTLQNCSVPI